MKKIRLLLLMSLAGFRVMGQITFPAGSGSGLASGSSVTNLNIWNDSSGGRVESLMAERLLTVTNKTGANDTRVNVMRGATNEYSRVLFFTTPSTAQWAGGMRGDGDKYYVDALNFRNETAGLDTLLLFTNQTVRTYGARHHAYKTLSYTGGTNVIVDLGGFEVASVSGGSLFTLTLTANAYFSQPTNFPPAGYGNAITIELIQDGTGSRTVAFDTNYWKFSSNSIPTISAGANQVSLLSGLTGSRGTNVYVSPSLLHR